MALSVQDDGRVARSNLHSCFVRVLEQGARVGNAGRFGIGFKSGSMRIAHDALILTRRDGQAAGLLSTTFLNAIDADDILIPMFTWTTDRRRGEAHHVASEPANTAEWEENMSVIEQYTYLESESAVLRELDKITTPTGTRIVLFNLKDPPEFDFSVKNDVRMLGIDPDEQNRTSARRPVYQQHRPGQQMTLDVPEDYSLRAYMEVLYLRPTVTFSLRGELIQPRCAISRLALEYYSSRTTRPRICPRSAARRWCALRVPGGEEQALRVPHLQQEPLDSHVPALRRAAPGERHDEGHARRRGGEPSTVQQAGVQHHRRARSARSTWRSA